jgi:hypothetical protein
VPVQDYEAFSILHFGATALCLMQLCTNAMSAFAVCFYQLTLDVHVSVLGFHSTTDLISISIPIGKDAILSLFCQYRNVTYDLGRRIFYPRIKRTPYSVHVSHKDNRQGLINHTNCCSVQDISSMDHPKSRYIPQYPRSTHQRIDCRVGLGWLMPSPPRASHW